MRFKYEIPSISRKQDAEDFIKEFYEYNSNINGVGGLDRYIGDYEKWLLKLEEDYVREADEEKVPARTYFLVRVDDNKIIGMTNIRLKLNEKLMFFGRNIGYCIRPTERGKGYNKINLYLALKECEKYNLEKVLLDVDKANIASWKSMEALGANLDEEMKSELEECEYVRFYSIDVKKSLEKYKKIYEPMIEN